MKMIKQIPESQKIIRAVKAGAGRTGDNEGKKELKEPEEPE